MNSGVSWLPNLVDTDVTKEIFPLWFIGIDEGLNIFRKRNKGTHRKGNNNVIGESILYFCS